MSTPDPKNQPGSPSSLSTPAQRARAEAEKRRAEYDKKNRQRPREIDGRDGPEPTRYGDWEKGGIISDF